MTANNAEVEAYALGLIVEEVGEVMEIGGRILQMIGKAQRFGIDTPGVKDPLTGEVDMSITPRDKIAAECGDFMAAVRFAAARCVIDPGILYAQADKKFAKLMNPESKDNLGRRLAP
jgi:hypothetical protein